MLWCSSAKAHVKPDNWTQVLVVLDLVLPTGVCGQHISTTHHLAATRTSTRRKYSHIMQCEGWPAMTKLVQICSHYVQILADVYNGLSDAHACMYSH